MNDPTDERILGDLPELPDHVWTAALDHAFDPQAEPDPALVPADDLTTTPDAALDDLTGDTAPDPLDTDHDTFGPSYDGDDASGYDHGYPDPGYDGPGFSDSDGYF